MKRGKKTLGDYGYVKRNVDETTALVDAAQGTSKFTMKILERTSSGIYVCATGQMQDASNTPFQRVLIIVDLRGNIGGGLGSLRLLSYLCPGKTEIGYSVTRRRLQKGYKKEKLTRIGKIPGTKAELLLMAVRFRFFHRDRSMTLVTEGLGPQPFHDRIVILINEYTRSGAEMVASFAKENRLATLVGTKTAGEVLGGANFKLTGGYILRIPVTGWYTWQGECIEGTGVEPDVAVENTPQSLASGIDRQLDKAIEVVQAL